MKTCLDCQSMAVWDLASAPIGQEKSYCDSCITRGCSCNFVDDKEVWFDDDGRSLPCCEYNFSEDGFED